MSEAQFVAASIRVCVSGGRATATWLGRDSNGDMIISLLVFFSLLAAILDITQRGRGAFPNGIPGVMIRQKVARPPDLN
jgi:hypothetical protein